MNKLIEIQNELKIPKGNLNKFGNYKYRSAEDILEALKPILLKHGALLTLSDSIEQIGTKLFLKAFASVVIGTEQSFVCGYAELSEHKGMSAEQCTGTASSYARKYALNGLFLIDETEQDADNDNKQPVKEVAKTLPSTTATELPPLSDKAFAAMLDAIAKGKGKEVIEATKKYTVLPQQLKAIEEELKKLNK